MVGKVSGTNSKGEAVNYSFNEGALNTNGKTHDITGTVGQSDVNASHIKLITKNLNIILIRWVKVCYICVI